MKRALIIGIGGMDGSYLADILLEQNYQVHGLYRRSSVDNLQRIAHCRDRVHLHQGDILDPASLLKVLIEVAPDEIYHVADQDSVGWSYNTVSYSMQATAKAVGDLLELIKQVVPKAKTYIPTSAMMFGCSGQVPQNENTPFNPQSPYACAKVAAFYLARYYRECYGLFVSTAILYNHDSIRRGDEYLLHLICKRAIEISKNSTARDGAEGLLTLASDAMPVDIGYAEEYMRGVVRMMQLDYPVELILASNKPATIREIVRYVFDRQHLSMARFVVDPLDSRPGGEQILIGNTEKAFKEIDWNPTRTWKDVCDQLLNKGT